jgi:hypothetical protein
MDPITLNVGGLEFTLTPRAFESGKIGYGLYGQFPVKGQALQFSVSLVIPHSEASVTPEANKLRAELAELVKIREAKKAAARKSK